MWLTIPLNDFPNERFIQKKMTVFMIFYDLFIKYSKAMILGICLRIKIHQYILIYNEH